MPPWPEREQVFKSKHALLSTCNNAIPPEDCWRLRMDDGPDEEVPGALPLMTLRCLHGVRVLGESSNPAYTACPFCVVAMAQQSDSQTTWKVIYTITQHQGHKVKFTDPDPTATGPEASTSKQPSSNVKKSKKQDKSSKEEKKKRKRKTEDSDHEEHPKVKIKAKRKEKRARDASLSDNKHPSKGLDKKIKRECSPPRQVGDSPPPPSAATSIRVKPEPTSPSLTTATPLPSQSPKHITIDNRGVAEPSKHPASRPDSQLSPRLKSLEKFEDAAPDPPRRVSASGKPRAPRQTVDRGSPSPPPVASTSAAPRSTISTAEKILNQATTKPATPASSSWIDRPRIAASKPPVAGGSATRLDSSKRDRRNETQHSEKPFPAKPPVAGPSRQQQYPSDWPSQPRRPTVSPNKRDTYTANGLSNHAQSGTISRPRPLSKG